MKSAQVPVIRSVKSDRCLRRVLTPAESTTKSHPSAFCHSTLLLVFAAVGSCDFHNGGVDGVAGLAPPLEAYGALIAGYARRKDADLALSAFQDFFELGGQPDFQMFDTVLEVCVRTGHFRRAMQVQTVLDLTPTITAYC